MRRLLSATTVALLLAPVAAADAATRYVVRGAGFGHGIGMSQYGAYGFAKKGRGYRAILGHYYRGTTVARTRTEPIRVLLQASVGGTAFRGATRLGRRRLNRRTTYTVRRVSSSRFVVRARRGSVVGRYRRPVRATSRAGTVRLMGTALNGLSGGRYRGALELRRGLSGGVTVVNRVGLDAYVKGVVPGEVPALWPKAALRAQAVAARSYALATDAGGPIFDQYPDTRSQVYTGASGEHPRTNAAVEATAKKVVRYDGRIAVTYFFSTSGGRTENVENVFYGSSPVPYLRSVRDPYDDHSPLHRWRVTFTQGQMESRLSGLVKGRFRGISVAERGVSPRIVRAYVRGSGGRTPVSGATLKARLGLYDTWASFARRRAGASTASTASRPLSGPLRVPRIAGYASPRFRPRT